MFKTLILSIMVAGTVIVSGCATTYDDSAAASKGGHYVVGSYDSKKAMFHCPAKSAGDDCTKIKVNIKK